MTNVLNDIKEKIEVINGVPERSNGTGIASVAKEDKNFINGIQEKKVQGNDGKELNSNIDNLEVPIVGNRNCTSLCDGVGFNHVHPGHRFRIH